MSKFKKADNEAARKLQLAMLNAIMSQIESDPENVSAGTLAVAERLLARYNVGLGFGLDQDNESLTEEEKAAFEEYEKLKMENDLFD